MIDPRNIAAAQAATLSPSLILHVTLGCAAIGYLTGCGLALIVAHPLLAFAASVLLALVSLQLHDRRERVVGVMVPGNAALVPMP